MPDKKDPKINLVGMFEIPVDPDAKFDADEIKSYHVAKFVEATARTWGMDVQETQAHNRGEEILAQAQKDVSDTIDGIATPPKTPDCE